MTTPAKYFHDRAILSLLIVNAVLVITGILLILFRLDSGKGSSYFIEFRSNVGIGEFKTGGTLDMLSFVAFLLVSLTISIIISVRVYAHRRTIAVAVLMMSALLSLLCIRISDALLVLR